MLNLRTGVRFSIPVALFLCKCVWGRLHHGSVTAGVVDTRYPSGLALRHIGSRLKSRYHTNLTTQTPTTSIAYNSNALPRPEGWRSATTVAFRGGRFFPGAFRQTQPPFLQFLVSELHQSVLQHDPTAGAAKLREIRQVED